MSTTSYVYVATQFKTDGSQTEFVIDLVRSPLYFPPQNFAGGSSMLLRPAFDFLRPRPSGVSGFNVGSSGVLDGDEVTVTYDTPPAAPIVSIQFRLDYTL